MDKKYISSAVKRDARPRSKRLREQGTPGGTGSGSLSIMDLNSKLDKSVWATALDILETSEGIKFLYIKIPVVTAEGITMYGADGTPISPSIFDGLPIDNKTIGWVDGALTVIGGTGDGEGTVKGIILNEKSYDPAENGYVTLPDLVTTVKWEDVKEKPTTIAGYGITDAYTKDQISTELGKYVTLATAQEVSGVKDFTGGIKIGSIPVVKHSSGILEIDGDLIVTGAITMFAQGSQTASTILDAIPIDTSTLSKTGGKLSVIGGGGGGLASVTVKLGTTAYDSVDGVVSLPAYPTTLPASDVYAWAKAVSKPTYAFSELVSHPTALAGYGITDAVNKTGDTMTGALKIMNGSSNYGGYLYFGDGSYVYLNEDTDDHLTIYASKGVNISTGSGYSFTVNGQPLSTSVAWGDVTGKPSWIGSSKPSYSWSEISSKPTWIGTTKPSYSWSEITSKPSWIGSSKPSYSFSEITSKPTTISGYGITDGFKAVALSSAEIPTGTLVFQGGFLNTVGGYASFVQNGYGGQLRFAGETVAYRYINNGSPWEWRTVFTTYNYQSLIDSRYVLKAGDTITGALTVNSSLTARSNLYVTQSATIGDEIICNRLRFTQNVKTTCKTTGWYRVYQGNYGDVLGQTVLLMVNRAYNYNSPESYIFAITSTYNQVNITQISGYAYSRFIPKIRICNTYDSAFAIDIYYNGSTSGNDVRICGIGQGSFTSPALVTSSFGTVTEYETLASGMKVSTNILAAGGITMYSDIRKKNIISPLSLPLERIANAPSFRYTFKDDVDRQQRVGTSAQYWLGVLPEVIGNDGSYYTLDPGTLAVACSISIAKHLMEHLRKEDERDKKIRELEQRINYLERRA
jgi:hypothetical protein